MKIINCNRELFYDLAKLAFEELDISPYCMELGVFAGNNAENIFKKINPKFLYLFDTWSSEDFTKAYKPFENLPKWIEPLEIHFDYYQGNASDNEHWLKIYNMVVDKFKNFSNISVIRDNSENLFETASKIFEGNKKLDFLYIDASHQYESVFKDIMLYSELSSTNSIIQLNDCCHSKNGIKQNLGVLEALIKFIKITTWRPIAINTTDFSDVILAKLDSPIYNVLNEILFASNIDYVDVPYQLLGNSKIIENKLHKTRLSFD